MRKMILAFGQHFLEFQPTVIAERVDRDVEEFLEKIVEGLVFTLVFRQMLQKRLAHELAVLVIGHRPA